MKNTNLSQVHELLLFISETFTETRQLAERAIKQMPTTDFMWKPDQNSNSLAVLMKHMGGFLQSRFTEFLTTDGEKSDRNRDSEFSNNVQNMESVFTKWDNGWDCLEHSLASLSNADLKRTIVIRGESVNVVQALLQALKHVSYHTGQIVVLVRLRSSKWSALSRPHKIEKG